MKYHSFRVDMAEKYGLEEAIFLNNIYHWIEFNRASNRHFYDGYYWTYNTQEAFTELFPYMSRSKIHRLTKKLTKEGILQTANYNKVGYDRTKWYSLTEKGEKLLKGDEIAIVQNEQSIIQNEQSIVQNEQTIPDINTDINTDSRTISSTQENILTSKMKNQVIERWNQLDLMQLRGINNNTKRYNMLKARIEEFGLNDVLEAIDEIEKSSFLKGQNDRGWTITFDWMIRPNNFIKVLEGNYRDKEVVKNERDSKEDDFDFGISI